MSYVTNSEIELRLGSTRYVQLTDDAGTGSASTDVVDEARQAAEGEVNSFLGQRYAVPIDLGAHPQAAPWLKSVSLDLIEQRLYARRNEVPADVNRKRNAAIDWLRQMAKGETALPSVAPISPNAAAGTRARVIGETRTLSRDELSGF